jgi:hypothetical protein
MVKSDSELKLDGGASQILCQCGITLSDGDTVFVKGLTQRHGASSLLEQWCDLGDSPVREIDVSVRILVDGATKVGPRRIAHHVRDARAIRVIDYHV